MKRFLTLIAGLIISVVTFAKPPQLNVEKMFDGSYNNDKTVSLQISKNKNKYFRGCTVQGNAKLVKKISNLFDKDSERAESSQSIISEDSHYSSMTIINNGQEIYVGLSFEDNNSCYLFISGSPEAFK